MYKTLQTVVGVLGTAAVVLGDGYLYPQPPLQFDEPSTSPAPIYLPPPLHDEVVPTYVPPLHDEILPPLDDTVVIPAPPGLYLPPTSKQTLQVLNMSCLDSRDGNGYFRTFVRTAGFPVMEGSTPECVVAPVGSNIFRIELEGQKMTDCGIRACDVRMCLVVRMASVPGLRLAEDPLVTLQCVPQETIVSHTKHLKLNAHFQQGRSNTRPIAIASGGNQRKFDTVVTILRRNNGVFDQPIQQGSAVRLGDELMLRTTVRDGDGWKYSRMGSVVIRSASSHRSAVLVDEHGCRNPTLRSICPHQPQQVAPLTVHFPFRAFLFQGAAPADDLMLSVRMSACLRPRDCYQSKTCEDAARTRAARAISNDSDVVTDWESRFQFRVLPKDSPLQLRKTFNWPLLGLGLVSCILACIVLCLTIKPKGKPVARHCIPQN